jgi:lipopolysaccharide/colanic/teichoic acid biosynthesis glycosyltransferase
MTSCWSTRTRLRFVPTTAELLLQRASFVPGQVVPLLELRPPVLTGIEWAVKRTFDIVVATLVLLILTPVLAAIALLVRLGSPGPIIYRDLRIGVGEGEFAMLKFRSMYADAQSRQASLEQHNEADGAIFKMRDDPRVTPFGRLLRRLSLDELPQLVNVLRGEMSLVGPRPLPVRDYERLGSLEPELRRPRAARLLLPRELVGLDGRRGARADALRGAAREGCVLI